PVPAAFKRRDKARAGRLMIGMDQIGIARCFVGEVDDEAFGISLVQAFRGDVGAVADGQVARHHRFELRQLLINGVAFFIWNITPEADEDAMADHLMSPLNRLRQASNEELRFWSPMTIQSKDPALRA